MNVAGGRGLHYVEAGSGDVVVLVHGFPLTGRMWKYQIDALAASYRVIVPDLRGFGRSPGTDGPVAMTSYARDVVDLLDALGLSEPVALAGFSMGGYVALALMRSSPDRVDALALIDTKATADTPAARDGRAAAAARVKEEGSGFMARAMIDKLVLPATIESRPDLADELVNDMTSQPPESVVQALEAMAERPDSGPLLGGLTIPTVVINGEADVIATPEEAKAMAAAIPDCEYVEIAGAGHLAPMEAPEAVNAALLDWLDRRE